MGTNELPSVDVKSSSWKGTFISILVILLLCSIITFAIYIINPDIQNKLARNLNKDKLKLSELLANKYSPLPTFNGTWITDTSIAFIDVQGNFVRYDVEQNETEIVIDATIMKQYEVMRATISPNGKYVLLISHIKGVFRHSSLAHYKIFNISSPSDIITVNANESNKDAYLQAAKWGTVGSQLAFVYQNNIYYMPDGLGQTIRITNDQERYIYNGIPDWIYEEEILAVGTAFWWSPDGTKLAFAQFNDMDVDFQEYPWYGDIVDLDSQYLDRVKIKYPKPGHTNPIVRLFVVDLRTMSLDTPKLTAVRPPTNLVKMTHGDHYLTSVAWINQNSLIAVWFTREQNYSSYSICSPSNQITDWECENNFEYMVKDGWVEVNKIYVGPDQENYYTLIADESKRKNVQIVQINIKTGRANYVTDGERDVTNIIRIVRRPSFNTTLIFYMATREGKPGERHAFSVEVSSRQLMSSNGHFHVLAQQQQQQQQRRQQANLLHHSFGQQANRSRVVLSRGNDHCYTCDQIELNQCLYNQVQISTEATYYVHQCLGPDIPYSTLRRTDNLTFAEPWLNNRALQSTLENKWLPTVRTELINKTDYVLIVQMFIPPTYKKDSIVKYPLLIQVYGGPGSQNVNENFKMNFGKYLASNKEIIYAYVDGRGSGYQGEAYKYQLYHKLGSAEIEDQIFAAKYLRDNYKFIDKDSIGIWGWSYGGYATAMILAQDTAPDPVFACGISVAPVTSWLLYDSAYTERYMGLPESNKQSYFKSDLMHLANNFKGKKYLLIHGTADDNVHVQNSMTLIKALNQANVMFQTQIYPDENHGLPGVSLHLYNRMENFWQECFQMETYIEEIGLRRRRIVKKGPI